MRYNAHNSRWAMLGAVCALLMALAGCGGGSGGGPGPASNPVTVIGTVLSVESGLPASAGATVTIGGNKIVTDASGNFTLANVASNTTSGTVTAANEQALTLALTLKPNVVNNLGTIYISNAGYTASVTGRVVAMVGGVTQPVGNAKVTIANASGTTGTDGRFTLTNLPVGLGATAGFLGKVSAPGFEDKPITADTLKFALTAGANDIGDLLVAQPTGSVPAAPFTIRGVVTAHGAPASGVSVSISSGGLGLGVATTDSTGTYFFWVVPGTYTLAAQVASAPSGVSVTLSRLDVPVTAPTIALP